jgi:hypothetical protein
MDALGAALCGTGVVLALSAGCSLHHHFAEVTIIMRLVAAHGGGTVARPV